MAVVAIDFDGVISDNITHEPIEGVKEAINLLREYGHRVVVNSCNNPEYIESFMNNHGIMFDRIHTKHDGGKVLADLYLDDRGMAFEGNWPRTVQDILQHRHIIDKDNRKW